MEWTGRYIYWVEFKYSLWICVLLGGELCG
jgi:hypothetical protein